MTTMEIIGPINAQLLSAWPGGGIPQNSGRTGIPYLPFDMATVALPGSLTMRDTLPAFESWQRRYDNRRPPEPEEVLEGPDLYDALVEALREKHKHGTQNVLSCRRC
jgi:hypothetical protein